ncbi:MAG: glutathione S-transferase family protein [Rubrivivax sp.]
MSLQLLIGNKNYSSWSMRSWVLMRQLDIGFEEIALRLDFSEGSAFRRAVAAASPAGRVPVLVDGSFAVWDTLAIAEYLHEKFPSLGVWPTTLQCRARARSLCAEMHSGFSTLRGQCPMNVEASLGEVGQRIWAERPDLRLDVQRIDSMWTQQLGASGGPMLFGGFSAADAYFAPVCSRFITYALPISDAARAYVERVAQLPAVVEWNASARAERDFLDFDEPYRHKPDAPA